MPKKPTSASPSASPAPKSTASPSSAPKTKKSATATTTKAAASPKKKIAKSQQSKKATAQKSQKSQKSEQQDNGASNGAKALNVASEDYVNQPEGTVAPPHRVFLRVTQNQVHIKVTLPRIPDSCINFEPTAKLFHVDTLKFGRGQKYFLEFPYPNNITIDPSRAEATLEYGILNCVLPLATIPKSVVQRELAKIDEIRESKLARKPLRKRKREEERLAALAANGGKKPEAASPQSNKKAKTDHKPKPKAEHVEGVPRNKALSLVEEVNVAEEQHREEIYQKELKKYELLNAKKLNRLQRRAEKREKINQLAGQVMDRQQRDAEDRAPVKAASARRVGFQE